MKVIFALFALSTIAAGGCGPKDSATPDPALTVEQTSGKPPAEPAGSTPENPSGAANPEFHGQ